MEGVEIWTIWQILEEEIRFVKLVTNSATKMKELQIYKKPTNANLNQIEMPGQKQIQIFFYIFERGENRKL
jgi:hypothetical protein